MKTISVFSAFSFYLFFSMTATAQQMPAPDLVRTLNCSLNPGITMGDAVEWGRNLPRDEYTPEAVYFREAIHHNSNFRDNFDFQIAWYHGTWEEYVMRLEGNRGGGLAFRQLVRPGDIMTCDPGSDRLTNSRPIPNLDVIEGDDSLMLTRLCFLNDDFNNQDAYRWLLGAAENFRRAGSTSLIQMNTRVAGPLTNLDFDRRGFVIQEVGSTPGSLAARMDIVANGMAIGEGLEPVIRRCNYPVLWRTHIIYEAPA